MLEKRALFFVNSLSGGGAERVCLNLSEQLNKQGFQCDYITLYKNGDDYELPEYVNVFSLGIPCNANKLKKMALLFKGAPVVNRYLKNKTYSLVTAHLPMSHIFASMTKLKKKTLYVMHNAQWPLNPKNSKLYNSKINLFYRRKNVVTVSEGIRNELIAEYGLTKVTTIYNPVLLDRFQNVEPIRQKRPYFISVGRLSFPKRPDLVLDLFYKGGFFRKFDLVFLGQGDKLQALKEQVKRLGIEKSVAFKGFQKNPYEWIAGAELMLSVSDSEAMPMNIVEALCCKTKVVAADCKYGPNEILTGELKNFLIHPAVNVSESIEKIEKAITQYPEIEKDFVLPFDSQKIAMQYLELWQKECSLFEGD